MSIGGVLVTALLVTLARPSTWILALAAFLVRGGILILCLPIVILPTPVGVANLVGPTLIGFVFGGVSTGFIALAIGLILTLLAWILLGGALAAVVETELARVVAADEDVTTGPATSPGVARRGSSGRVLAARLFTLAPLMIALLWGAAVIVAVAYRELTLPTDVTRPIMARVVAAVPETVILLVAAWVLSEVLAARAARRIVLDGASVPRAIGGAVVDIVRRPLASLACFAVPTIVLVLVLVPITAATAAAWNGLRTALQSGHTPVQLGIALIGFVGLWLGGLTLTAMVCAWRQAVWTVDSAGRRPGASGASPTPRAGDWNRDASSVTL